jgi:tetratricopeptide (TPR) repeat protein
MGLCYRYLSRYDEARKYLIKGLQLDPDSPTCLFNLGFIAARQGDMQEAENYFQAVLKAKPNYNDALFELAGVRMKEKKFQEAAPLLRRCLELNPNRSETYYKLATTERALHQTEAAERDFRIFETMSRNGSGAPYPMQHLFEYLDQKMGLPPQARANVDLAELQMAVSKHPETPRNLYLLAKAYLRLGRTEEAQKVVDHLDDISGGDSRTALQVGVLLARYHLISDAVRHFKAALATDPSSDDAKYDLANAYFEQQDYTDARHMLDQISAQGCEDEPYLALLGDTDTRLGRLLEAQAAYRKVIEKSPDNDVHYLSLALSQLSGGDTIGAGETLHTGLSRVPDSGRIAWGLGVLSVMEAQCQQAEKHFDRALDLLPDWPSAYSALAVLYLNTGQAAKARAVFQRYQEIFPRGPFHTEVIEKELAAAEERPQGLRTITPQMQSQFLLLAFAFANIGLE